MASVSQEIRRNMQRRDSSTSTTSSGGKRRPRLLRSSVTEPSITASNACRGALACSPSSQRATDLLSQVAYIAGAATESLFRGSTPPSAQSSIFDRTLTAEPLSITSSPASQVEPEPEALDEIRPYPYSGRYFSFPSFDTWDEERQEKEDAEPKDHEGGHG